MERESPAPNALARLYEKAEAGTAFPAPGRVQREDAARFLQAARSRSGRQGQVATWAVRILAGMLLAGFLAALIAAIVRA